MIKHDAYQDGFAAANVGDPRNPKRFGAGTIAQAATTRAERRRLRGLFNDAKPLSGR